MLSEAAQNKDGITIGRVLDYPILAEIRSKKWGKYQMTVSDLGNKKAAHF